MPRTFIIAIDRANRVEFLEAKRAFKLLYRSELNTKQALAKAAETEFGPVGREFFEFVANAGKRGIVSSGGDATED